MTENSKDNTRETAPQHQDPPRAAGTANAMELEPIEGPSGFFSTFETILRRPGGIIHHLANKPPGQLIRLLLGSSIACLLAYGVVVGTFSMGHNLWASPLKILFGVFFAGLICLPSLYIFSCLSNLKIRFSTVAGMLAAITCLASLVLVGFAPVVWIFSQSTGSVPFVGGLNLIIWSIALWFGLELMRKGASALGAAHTGHLKVWMGIFVLVTLQMTTTLRPIIGEQDAFLSPEKKFFLVHWLETLHK